MTKRAIFLDRDGVINIDHGYVHKKENFEFVDSIFDFCKEASKLEYLIFVVTNQSGIGRGYYTEKEFLDLTNWMQECFIDKAIKIEKVNIDKLYVCYSSDNNHPDRKPNPGMINQAIHEYDIDPDQSILIGDNITDVISGMKAGVKNIFLYNNEQSSSHCLE